MAEAGMRKVTVGQVMEDLREVLTMPVTVEVSGEMVDEAEQALRESYGDLLRRRLEEVRRWTI